MSARTELDLLAAARPAILDRTDTVVDTAAQSEILTRIVGTPRMPPPLPPRLPARRPGRGPRRVTAAMAAAVVVAGGVVTYQLTGAGNRSATSQPANNHAVQMVAYRTAAALRRIDRNWIVGSAVAYRPVSGIGWPAVTSPGSTTVTSWSYRAQGRVRWRSTSGPQWTSDSSWAFRHGLLTQRYVDYGDRSVWVTTFRQPPISPDTIDSVARLAAYFRHVARSGKGVTLVRVHGVPMYKIAFGASAKAVLPLGFAQELRHFIEIPFPLAVSPRSVAAVTWWVSARSYVPVSDVVGDRHGTFYTMTMSLLRPDPANLRLLTAPIPRGFRITRSTRR